jgi:hypothetical protein
MMTRERGRDIQRLEKLLEDAGIKLSSVASDINGVSGRLMLQALMTDNAIQPCWPIWRSGDSATSSPS